MNNNDTKLHVQGLSLFTGDIPLPEHGLFAAVFTAPYPHGKILNFDPDEAAKTEGVVKILTSDDIPGKNQIGHIIADEPLLAETEFSYVGQPIAVVLAENRKTAQKAVSKIKMEYEKLPFITSPRQAYQQGEIIGHERIFSCGNTAKAKDQCSHIFKGTVESGAQEHLYLETQTALAIPLEKGKLKVISSTQSPSAVQKTVAEVLALPLNEVESEVLRLGGGFGGKEDQANAWAAIAALGAYLCNRAVKITLPRKTDLNSTGKRHPYSSDFCIGLNSELKIIFYEVSYYQNAGACTDLSPSVLERTLFHSTNSYFIPNVKATAASCRTNLPPNTAFRGFGGPQAMFVIESAIYEAAKHLNVPANLIQQRNLIKSGQHFPYGMKMQNNHAELCFEKALNDYDFEGKCRKIAAHNSQNITHKKGISVMPICFGISFTSIFLNQASALLHLYNDGSIGISTGAVEMGQGVNQRIRKIAAHSLGVYEKRIRIESTNTSRIANMSPTAASTGTDLNGNAALLACREVKNRLLRFLSKHMGKGSLEDYEIENEIVYFNKKPISLNWEQLVEQAYLARISLSAHAFYATPEIYFDKKTEKGEPFSYHISGTAITEVSVDCLRGNYCIDSVEVVHDTGASIDLLIELGQMEGGIVQGIGWMTMEEIRHSEDGKLITNTLSTYKVPDVLAAPQNISVKYLEKPDPSKGVLGAKATGEPPFMYGIGTYFALINAVRAFKPDAPINYLAPLTNERLFMMLYDHSE